MLIVIPDFVEYLNPKSFMRSSIFDVSVILYRLNTAAIILPKYPFLNGGISSFEAIASFTFSVGEIKYFSGVASSRFSLVGSLIYGNDFGKISLKINLPIVVINNFLFCSSVKVGLLRDPACTATRVCKCT